MIAELPSTSAEESQARSFLRIAGSLAIVGGVMGIILSLLDFVFGFPGYDSLILFVTGLLSAAGGFLALRETAPLAQWLMLAAVIPMALVVPARVSVGAAGLFSILRILSLLLTLAAFVLARVAFNKAPQMRNSAISAANTTAAIAVPNADGSIPEGWYADPDGKPSERYWDGSEWTDRSRPRTTATAAATVAGAMKPTVTATGELISPKSRAAAAILCWFLGIIGIHRFYVGKVGTGIAQIFTLGGLGIWVLVDFIMILAGSFRDSEDKALINW